MVQIDTENFDPSQLQELRPGDVRQADNVTIRHTGNSLGEVHLTYGEARLTVSLRKGGTVISTRLRGEELFALDEAYTDLSKITRTKGSPLIFPVFNQVLGSRILAGAQVTLPNHGVARLCPWKAYAHHRLPGILILQLMSNDETKIYYPYIFTYTQFLILDEEALTIQQLIDTDGPFSVGFHPYFRVGDKHQIEIEGIDVDANYLYLPNSLSKEEKDAMILQNRTRPYTPGKHGSLDFAHGEVNHHFLLRQNRPITLTDLLLKRRLVIERSNDYKGLTVWCRQDEESSVCIEPVTDLSGHMGAKPSPWSGYVRFAVEPLDDMAS